MEPRSSISTERTYPFPRRHEPAAASSIALAGDPASRNRWQLLRVLVVLLCVVAPEGTAQIPFRFAWLSDTHVGGSTGAEDLSGIVRDINEREDIGFVLVSGDVTETGSNAQLLRARQQLDSLQVPYHVIPGNHDTKWSESGTMMFPRLFGADRFAFFHGGVLFVGIHQGPLMRMADGHWSPELLRWVDSLMTETPVSRPVVVVTHYPVDSSISNWYELLDRLRGKSVQAILVGHGHRNALLAFEGIPGVMSRSILGGANGPAGYTMVEVTADSMRFLECRSRPATTVFWGSVARTTEPYRPGIYPRPGYEVNGLWPGIRTLWQSRIPATLASRPAAILGRCVIGSAAGKVYALSLDEGNREWEFDAGAPVFSSPDTADGKVVMGAADGNVYCLDAATGAEQWRFNTGAHLVASPTVRGGTIYIGASDGCMRALDLATGKLRWQSARAGGFIEAAPAVTGELIIVGAWDSRLYAFDRLTGAIRWTWHGDRPGILYSPAAGSPVVVGNMVYVVAPDRAITAVDIHTGRQIWRSFRHQVREAIGGSPDGSTVYVRTLRDTVVAFVAGAPTLVERWISHAGFGYDLNPAPPVCSGTTLFYGTKNGLVFALEASTGRLLWKHRVGVSLVNEVVPIDPGRLLVTDMDGFVRMLSIGGSR